ncbi:YopX family protein [Polaribacter ponticola]|uniref:YopX family protein n=1 Tax=Polaribacter ponticola TaxID=2978475 RepID=A0ABT5S531_9FLAO|nr:YopX family protein [Polaribacter sp. MSW5]MDD7912949.1 YopX family protein [Polaribacter sp. MSW5]MDD7913753.1 YopX family protein [Polaribacter sp. MSW5]
MKNRKIEFRAFSKNKMYYLPVINGENKNWLQIDKTGVSVGTENGLILDFQLMQFTGSFDKNGKKIFEGDILKEVNFGYTYEVIYKDNSFVCNSDIGISPLFETENFEVVGNIFENALT